jgi:hypothetical protein
VTAFRTFVWFGTAILRQQALASMIANNSIRHCRAKTRQSMGKAKRVAGERGLPGLRPVMTKKERSERNTCRRT